MNRRKFIQVSVTGLGMIACRHCLGDSMLMATNAPSVSDKYTRNALYFKKTAHGVQCDLCPKACNVSSIRPGECKTRVIRNGKFVSIAYGNPYYVNVEMPELESLYHFKPGSKMLALGTAGCTLACQYCKVWAVSQKSPEEVSHRELFPAQVVQSCIDKGSKTIVYTYTEPVAFFEYMLETAKLAHQKGIRNVMISNGFINEAPLRELAKYLDGAVIDVKAFSNATYQTLTTGSIAPVLRTIKVLKEMNVWTELTHLLIHQKTDNYDLLKRMCEWMIKNGLESTPFHFNKFEPDYQLKQLSATPESLLIKAKEIAINVGLKHVYVNNLSGHQNTKCPKCNNILVERSGNKVVINKIKNGKCKYCNETIGGIW